MMRFEQVVLASPDLPLDVPVQGVSRTVLRLPAVALVVALLWASFLALIFPYPVQDDAKQYDTIAENLVAGHGFSLSIAPPFTPTMYREPAYPVFLSGVFLIAGHRPAAAQAAQIMLFLLTVLFVHWIAQAAFDEKTAQLASLATALAPPLANFPSYLLSETFFTCVLVALVWALLKTVSGKRVRWFVFTGLLWGTAILSRAITMTFAVPIVLAWFLLHRQTQVTRTRLAVCYIACLCSALALVGPWVLRNQRQFGTGAIALRGGRVIWERAQRLDYTPAQVAQTLVFSFSEFAGKTVFPKAVDRPRDFLLRESGLANQRVYQWEAEGLSEQQIEQRFLQEALPRLHAHPLIYLAQSGLEWIKLTAFSYLPVLNERALEEQIKTMRSGRLLLAVARGAIRMLAFPVLLLAGVGGYMRRLEWRRWLFVALPIIIISAAYCLFSAYGRYAVPLLPLYLIFASAGWRALWPTIRFNVGFELR